MAYETCGDWPGCRWQNELVVGLTEIDVTLNNRRSPYVKLHSQAQAFCGSCGLNFMVYYGHAFFVFIRKGGKRARLG